MRPITKEHAVMVMGLDLTYRRRFYQQRLRRVLPHAQHVLAISAATECEALARGVRPDCVHVLLPGVLDGSATSARPPDAGTRLKAELGLPVDATILLTLGRLVRRKGVRWFVSEVMPRLPQDLVYLVAGSGPDRDAIRAAVDAAGEPGTRVKVLGQVDERLRDLLLGGSDVFVMPNIPIPGDMEGFGLVAVEAAARGAVVVAAGLEGINDAVIDGSTGFLVPPGDAAAFADRITTLVRDPGKRQLIADEFAALARTTFSVARMQAELVALISSAPRS
jgi:glycosyltransferase involved in cell wall biosynthesis